MAMSQIVVQKGVLPLLDEISVGHESRHGELGVADAIELVAGLCLTAIQSGAVLFNLMTPTRHRMDRTIHGLRQLGVERLGPGHCTGSAATAELWNALLGRCFSCAAGTGMELEVS